MHKTGYFFDPFCQKHEIAPGHPESPARVSSIHQALKKSGLLDKSLSVNLQKASKQALCLAHDPDYVDSIYQRAPISGTVMLDPDTSMNEYTLDAALLAAGAVIEATNYVIDGKIQNAFCNVRPPGHHAERYRAMGFCIFNNIALAAKHALDVRGLKKIAIVDFDVHHGNGTEDIFQDDARVLICQTYQSPFYPGTGGPNISGHIVNEPLTAGSGSEEFRHAFKYHCLPELQAFKPELIFISAGFDAHKRDPLAQCSLEESDYRWVTDEIVKIAKQSCAGKIVSSLEGGYDLEALAASAVAHVKALVDATA